MDYDNQDEFPLEWRIDNAVSLIEDYLRAIRMGFDVPNLEDVLEELRKELDRWA